MIAHSAVQSSQQCLINRDHSLLGKPYLAIIASNVANYVAIF